MRKRVRADFFRVQLPTGAPPFTELLNRVLTNRPRPLDRNIEIYGYTYRLHLLERIRNLWSGCFIRIRMDDLPNVAELDGELRDLPLEADEGLGEETSFVYTPGYGVMVIQRNFQAVRPGTVETYLARLTEVEDLLLEPVIQADALEKLQRMQVVRNIDLSLATPTDPGVYRRLRSVAGALNTARYVGAARISVSMGMGRRKGSLNAARAIDIARRLFRVHRDQGQEVQKIVVRGSRGFADEPMETIDLLSYRLVEEFGVETADRQLRGPAVRQELAQALRRQDDDLRRQFGRA